MSESFKGLSREARIAEREMTDEIADIVHSAREEVERGYIDSAEDLDRWVHETIDGHAWVIYTWLARCLAMAAPTDLLDEAREMYRDLGFGQGEEDTMASERLAYCILDVGVREAIGDPETFLDETREAQEEALEAAEEEERERRARSGERDPRGES